MLRKLHQKIKIKQILASGSCESPVEITKKAGIDITKAAFWEKSIAYIKDTLDQLEDLIEKNPELIAKT